MLSSRNKTKTTAVSFILLLVLSVSASILPAAYSAAVPSRKVGAYLSVAPKLLGVNQELTVNCVIWPSPAGPTFYGADFALRYEGYRNVTVTFTKPDGSTETFMPEDVTLNNVGVHVPLFQ